MENLTALINSTLSRELQALLYQVGYYSQQGAYRVYAVGGFVRDLLLERENRDLDLVVEGSAVDFARSLQKVMPGMLRCYERFGTATLTLPKGVIFDMVTAREEFYALPGALPTVQRSSLKNDLYRRDFTVNTLACALNPEEFGRFFDFFAGREDLKNGLIKVLYKLSFVDDPLRMIRAVRFEQRFAFTIEEETLQLLKNAVKNRLWEKVSKERLYREVGLVFREPRPARVLQRFAELNMFPAFFPRLDFNRALKNRLQRLEGVLAENGKPTGSRGCNHAVLFLSALFYDLDAHDLQFLCSLMRLKRQERRDVCYIRENMPAVLRQLRAGASPAALYFLLKNMPEEGLLLALALNRGPRIREQIDYYREHLRAKKPLLTGKDLQGAGLTPGPVYRRILQKLHAAVLEGVVNGKEEELEFVNLLIKNG